MKTAMYIYAGLLLIMSFGNMGFFFYKGEKSWLLIYETLSGVVLAGAIFVYFNPVWFDALPLYGLIPVALAVIMDLYWSLRGDFGRESAEILADAGQDGIGEGDWEVAETVSLILVSPAYLVAMLLIIDKLKVCFK